VPRSRLVISTMALAMKVRWGRLAADMNLALEA
jgi:hypothetical protein